MEIDQSSKKDNGIRAVQSAGVFVNAYGQSAGGKSRTANQDQFLIAALNRQLDVIQSSIADDDCVKLGAQSQGWIFVVAAGMGGPEDGEEASALAVESIMRYIRETMPWFVGLGSEQVDEAENALRSIVRRCHRALVEAAGGRHGRRCTATTLTLAYVLWPHLFVVHAGDSRCFLLRDDALRQITLDHTPAHLGDAPGVDPDAAAVPRPTGELKIAVGDGEAPDVEPEVHRLKLVDRDALLLCSDGLTKVVPNETIGRLMATEGFANSRCHALLEAADAAGRPDDTTVVVASFGDFGARLKAS